MAGKYWTQMYNTFYGCMPAGPECAECWALQTVGRMQVNPLIARQLDSPIVVDGKWTGRIHYRQPMPRLTTRGTRQIVAVNWLGDIASVADHHVRTVITNLERWQIVRHTNWCQAHVLLFLTHRPKTWRDKLVRLFPNLRQQTPLQVWWGVTVTNQEQLDGARSIFDLPGHHWLSVEPMRDLIVFGDTIRDWDWITIGVSSGPSGKDMTKQFTRQWLPQVLTRARGIVPVWVKSTGDRHLDTLIDTVPTALYPREMPSVIAETWAQ